MIKRIVVLMISILLCAACSRDKGIKETVLDEPEMNYPLKFEKVGSVGLEDLSYPNLYFDEWEVGVYGYTLNQKKMEFTVHRFSHNLNFLSKKNIPIGIGPAETGSGTDLYSFKEKFITCDNTISRFMFFDRNFNVLKTIPAIQGIPSTVFENGSFCLIKSGEYRKNKYYSNLNLSPFPNFKKKKLYEFLSDTTTRRVYGRLPEIDFFVSNQYRKIYVLNMTTYELMCFDMKGEMEKRIRVKTETAEIGAEDQVNYIREFMGEAFVKKGRKFAKIVHPSSVMVPLKRGIVVIRRKTWQTLSPEFCDGDMFDYQLNLLGKVKIPGFYRCYFVHNMRSGRYAFAYRNGYFFAVKDIDDVTFILEKWRVIE